MLSMKQAQTPAVSRIVTRRADPLVLRARGPPDRGLPGRAAGALRPVGGLVRARRRRPGDQGALALRGRPRLGRRHRDGRDDPARATTSAARPPRSTASPTRATSTRWSTSTSRRRSRAVIGDREDEFVDVAGGVGRRVRPADARGPPPLRRRVPQRDDPRGRVRLAPSTRTLWLSVRRLPAASRASILSAIERARLVVRRSLTTMRGAGREVRRDGAEAAAR